MKTIMLLTCLLFCTSAWSGPQSEPAIDKNRISVSGISAGGQMAHQLHIAYADIFSGAGIIAGGPYGCADGSLTTAMSRCMGSLETEMPVAALITAIHSAASDGRVADPAALANDPVWLFHGTLDTVVAAGVSNSVEAVYAEFMPEKNIRYINTIPAAHNFPVRGHGSDCAVSKSPFIGDCDYDAAGELLQHLYPDLNAPTAEPATELVTVKLEGAAKAGLLETVYLFVPDDCNSKQQSCALHLVLHGCAQSSAQIGTAFIDQSGYLPWAQANNIVLAFPQVAGGASNPYACWDWWGYTGADYRFRNGAQMILLADWVRNFE